MAVKNKTINRDISWLSFNERVLQEAIDKNVPLVERIRFLGIFSNNQDEFFKVRVATIKRMIDLGYDPEQLDGENPKKTIIKIQEKVIQMQNKFTEAFESIISEFEKENIFLINEKQLNEVQSRYIDQFFDANILPFLSPIMLNNVDKFPYLKDKSIYFAIKLTSENPKIPVEYALMEIPSPMLNRVILLPPVKEKKFIIFIDDVIRYCLKDLFKIFNYDHFEAFTIKLTRDAELDIDNDLSKSFLEKISEGVSERSKGQPVRFVYDREIPDDLLNYIIKRLQFDNYDTVIPSSRYHNFKDIMSFPNIGGTHLEYSPTPPIDHPLIKHHESMINLIASRDIMVHHPYQKFDHFVDFLREASMDPKVKSIKITLYRVARNSKVINALINAARNGKQVIVVIELQARFDEKSNIYWSKKLEEVGATVLFGIKGLKIHCKLVQVVRREGKTNQCYSVISTGNFHEGNTDVYTDITLFTCDKRITTEVDRVFQFFDRSLLEL